MTDALKDAQLQYNEALGVQGDQRRQIEEDARFSDPSCPDQWETDVRHQRENDPGGKRPCLVFDQTGQYVANVAGQIEKQPPGLHSIPVGGGADKLAAEQMDGRFRHIEYASRATQHYQRALTSAARLGVGYLIVRPEKVNAALNYQEPRIDSEPDPLKVVFDPWCDQTDGAGADFAFLLTALSKATCERRWPGKDKLTSFGDLDHSGDDRDSVLIAEQWVAEQKTENCIVCMTNDGERSMSEDEFHAARQAGEVLVYLRNYSEKKRIIKWRQMSGDRVLAESVYSADEIGVVPVYGYVGWKDGRMRYCGIPRRARVPQQAYNYHMSEAPAFIGTAPRSPWIVVEAAIANASVQALWDNASTQQRAWLPYLHKDENGDPIPPPQRINAGTNVVNHEAGARQAKEDIQASIGMYQASLGAPSNETSGVAIESRKQQGEASTAHFPSHMAASLTQVGKICQQMDARLADTKRKAPLIGVDGSAGSVTIDPELESASQRGDDGGVTINPRRGEYGVRVVIGASYSTQRSQTNAAFGEIMRGNKDMVPIVAPFWAQTLDFPGSEKMAQAFAAMAPPPVKAILQPEGEKEGPSQAELTQQVAQLRQQLQEATGIAQEAEQAETEARKDAGELQMKLADKMASIEIDQYKAETDRLQVTGANVEQIEAIVAELVNQMLSGPAPLPGDAPQPLAPQIGGAEVQAEPQARPADAPESPMQPDAQPAPEQPMQPMTEPTASQEQ